MSSLSGLRRRVAARLSNLPGSPEVRRLARQLRSPRRASAVRGAVDGVYVTWKLRRDGVRRLMPPAPESGGPRPVSRDDPGAASAERDLAREVAAAVDAGLGLVPMAKTCLRRSLTLTRELHRVGVTGTVHIGVRRRSGGVEAHAWVQVDETVVNDDPDEVATYAQLATGELEQILPSLR